MQDEMHLEEYLPTGRFVLQLCDFPEKIFVNAGLVELAHPAEQFAVVRL